MFNLLFYLLHILSLPAICILIYDICIFVFSYSVSGAPCTCRVHILCIFHLCSLPPTHPSPDWFQSTCKRMTAWMIKQGLIDTFPFSCNEFLISVPALRQAQGFAGPWKIRKNRWKMMKMYQNHHIPTDSNLLQNVDNRGCAFAADPETMGWGYPKFVGPTVPVWRGRGESPMRHTPLKNAWSFGI